MRIHSPVACLLLLGFATAAEANHEFRVILHARIPSGTGSCTEQYLPNCVSIRPTTQVAAGADFRLFVFIKDYVGLAGFQTAFAWPADWVIDPATEPAVTRGCRGNQLVVSEPHGSGGPTSGTYATAFDCVLARGLAAITRIDFIAGAGGCIIQVNPTQGTRRVEILDCENRSYMIDASNPAPWEAGRLGTICAGQPGRDVCEPLLRPVAAVTWGRIKDSYR